MPTILDVLRTRYPKHNWKNIDNYHIYGPLSLDDDAIITVNVKFGNDDSGYTFTLPVSYSIG